MAVAANGGGGNGRRAARHGAVAVGLALAAAIAGLLPATAAPIPDAAGRLMAVPRPGAAPVNLYVEEHGAGPPVLLLHGLGESTFTWHDILPALAARNRVIALDLKGFGRSDKPEDGAYTADDQAALVARFIVDSGLEGLTVIGHSFGGTVALRTALADGISGTGRIRRIALIGAPALPGSTPRYFDAVKTPALPDAAASAIPPEALARMLLGEAMGGTSKVKEEDVEGYAAPYREPAAMRAFLATARAIVNEGDRKAVAARYRKIAQPVLLVWCREDDIVPLKAGRRLAAVLPHARLTVLDGCHHLPQHEKPQELLGKLTPFLER
jgi:pimeloyl-ACP methyl ester carboxylesterase